MKIFDPFRSTGTVPVDRSASKPDTSVQEASQLIDEGNALEDAGQLEEAMQRYEAALLLAPNLARAHLNRGNILSARGDMQGALTAYSTAIKCNPDYAGAHYNLGNASVRLGHLEAAVDAYQNAIRLQPDYADAEVALGGVLEDMGRYDDAVASYHRALQIKPDYAEAHNNLGNALTELGQFDEAMASYHRALQIKPDYAEAHVNLGNALKDLGQLDAAVASYHRAQQVKPDFAEAHSNLGNALKELGQYDEAVASCRRALEIKPDFVEAHANLGIALLETGQYSEGWQEYEYRWEGGSPKQPRPPSPLPQWTGQKLAHNDRLLVFVEQGLGDMLQFARYLPLAAERFPGGVSVHVIGPMLKLFRRSFPMIDVLDTLPADQRAWQWQCPLLSLPLAFGTTLDTIPHKVPYLTPDPVRVTYWQNRIAALGLPASTRKIGVVGKPGTLMKTAPQRALTLQTMAPLLNQPDCAWFSLQKEPDPERAPWVASGKLIDWTDEFGDFNETASLAMNLDLIISVDTSVAHLAGGLGLPTWLLNRHASEWRWMRNREDSPWYPTMRIFTQRNAGDWDEVVSRMSTVLMVELSPI